MTAEEYALRKSRSWALSGAQRLARTARTSLADLLEGIRDWNEARPPENRLAIDVESTGTFARAVAELDAILAQIKDIQRSA